MSPPPPRVLLPVARTKQHIIGDLLADSPIRIYCDGRRCTVPGPYHAQKHLILRFGWSLSPPIPDLTVGKEALQGTLSFSGVRFPCTVPYGAIFAVGPDGDEWMVTWPKDYPSDEVIVPEPADAPNEMQAPSQKRGGHLRLVPLPEDPTDPSDGAS